MKDEEHTRAMLQSHGNLGLVLFPSAFRGSDLYDLSLIKIIIGI